MADIFTLTGSYSVAPASGQPSMDPSVAANILETSVWKAKQLFETILTSDSAASVSFGGVANAHEVVIKSFGNKVKVRITSADGATQSIPVDDFLFIESLSVPITAIDLTRVAGIATTVKVLLGEKA